jgi:Tfp pilus assembly protein PilN
MERNAFGLSALNGQFRALALRKGAVATFEWATPADDFGSLPQMLREAARRTGTDARSVAVVLAHPRLTHNIVETPPVKGWKLQQFLQRRVRALKTFPAEADWSWLRALNTKKGDAALVHILPRPALESLVNGCRQAGLQLHRVIPTTSVLSHQLKQLPIERDEIALLAAETGPTTTVVVGNRDGQVCLCRVLWNNWNQQVAQVGMDLTRTIGFAEQQTGRTIGSVWMFGEGAEQRLVQMQELLKRPVQLGPVKPEATYWADQAIQLPEKEDGNLISVETRRAPVRRRFALVTTMLLLLFFVACLAATGFFELLRQSRVRTNAQLTEAISQLQGRKQEWEKRYQDLADKKKFINVVHETRPPAVPGWFLAYLGQVVPDDMVLTQLHVARTNAHWQVQLGGLLQLTNAAVFGPAQVVARLAESLNQGPFHFTPRRSGLGAHPGAAPSRFASAAGGAVTDTNTFFIEGVIE